MKSDAALAEFRHRLDRVIDHIDRHPDSDLSLDALARVANFSPFHFHRVFKAYTGRSVLSYVTRSRLNRAVFVMRTSPQTVVRSIGLRTTWLNREAAGAGGALDQYWVEGAVLQLGSFIPRLAGSAGLDFEHVNAPLRANGSADVEVILGADVFDAHAAVIDYATESLSLKPVAAPLTDSPADIHPIHEK